jgi:chromosome segregation ATPase
LTESNFKANNEPQLVTIDHEEKGSLEQKYHLMKKKLKKQKEISEMHLSEIDDLRGQLETLKKEAFVQMKQSHDTSERRMRELENTLNKAYTNLRNLDKQNNELTQMKLDLEEEIRKREKQQKDTNEDIKQLL